MRRAVSLFVILLAVLVTSCQDKAGIANSNQASSPAVDGSMTKIADRISYDIIILPVEESDPWEFERLEGLDKKRLLDNLFNDIYESRVVPYNFFTGEPLAIKEIKAFEKEFDNDRSKIAKLQFEEDWYLDPVSGQIVKVVRSITAGYELTDFDGRRIGYKAIFRINYQEDKPTQSE